MTFLGRIVACIALSIVVGASSLGGARARGLPGPVSGKLAQSDAPVKVDESFSGTAEIALNGVLEVGLRAQFGSGFSWVQEGSLNNSLRLLRQETRLASDNAQKKDGGWERQIFVFQGIRPGEAQLRFAYRRPWEKPVAASKLLIFNVRIATSRAPG